MIIIRAGTHRSGSAWLRNSPAYAWFHNYEGGNRENNTGEGEGE